MTRFIQMLWARRELFANLTSRELKQRYKGSVLGFLWSILTPLLMAVIYVFFLRLMAGRGVPMEEIIIGVFAWQYTVQCVNGGLSCITGNANLVKKVAFPRVILPASQVAANLVNFLLSLVVQFVLIAILLAHRQAAFSGWLYWLPVILLIHTVFNFGLALLVSSLNVVFRDTQHLVGVFLSAWFFLSPVMYNLSFAENLSGQWPWVMQWFLLNPMAGIITAYRAAILAGSPFACDAIALGGLVGLPLALCAVGFWVFSKLQRTFADVL